MEETIVLDLVHEVRHIMPRIGVKKLYSMLEKDLHSIGKIGRDKLFDIMRKNNLLVKRKRAIHVLQTATIGSINIRICYTIRP